MKWNEAIIRARNNLKLKGFVPIGGKTKKGQLLLKTAKKLYKNKKGSKTTRKLYRNKKGGKINLSKWASKATKLISKSSKLIGNLSNPNSDYRKCVNKLRKLMIEIAEDGQDSGQEALVKVCISGFAGLQLCVKLGIVALSGGTAAVIAKKACAEHFEECNELLEKTLTIFIAKLKKRLENDNSLRDCINHVMEFVNDA